MTSFRFVILVILVAFAPALFALEFGVRAGRYSDINKNFVGAELAFPLGRNVVLDPNIEYILGNHGYNAGFGSVDLLYRFTGAIRPYVGAGVGEYRVSGHGFSDNTNVWNAIAGLDFRLGTLKPYGQVKYLRTTQHSYAHATAFTVGLRF